MYSTHTSSSYSPSISDGTITPNSLHQHHHHHHHQHLAVPPHLPFPNSAAYEEDSALALQTQRLQRQKTNGTLDGADYEDNANDNDNDNDQNNERIHKNDTKLCKDNDTIAADSKTTANIPESGEEHHQHPQQQTQQHHQLKRHGRHHRYAEHALRIPSKLRKIDRDSTTVGNGASAVGVGSGGTLTANAVKFDKLTGDGIKSGNNAAGADGSYQCQFCDKSFPRLGYLKKHEQVS